VGGYKALAKAPFEMKPEEIIEEIKASNLRGRGGANRNVVVPEKADVCAMCRECYELCSGGKVANIIGY